MTTLVMAAFLIFGMFGFFSLAINDLPAVDFPTIHVNASLPGANADTMASAVATPLEKQFAAIAGLDSMNSTSSNGSTQITLQFNLDRSIDGAAEDVQAAMVAARPFLPTSMPTPPILRKVNPGDNPILYVAVHSATLPIYTVDEYAENVMASRMSMVSGVAQVQVFGSQIYSPHVQVDPRRLAAYGIGMDEVVKAVRDANVNQPTGTLYGPKRAYNVKVNGQLMNADELRPTIVAFRNGSPVRLGDIGDVIDSVQTDKIASWYNTKRGVILAVQRQPGTNTIQIVDDIKKLLPTFRAILPNAVSVDILYDRSQSIRRSVEDVEKTLVLTIIFVVFVIFLFLGNLATTVIASLSLPIAIVGTFAFMKGFGFTLDVISLMALTVCTGFVVDDAIVVVENIIRHIERGESAMKASLDGAREVGFTVVSMTVSLVAVFIPVLLMGGIIGRLFFEFGATMSVAILISGFVSLSLTPMLCSRFLRPKDHSRVSRLQQMTELAFNSLRSFYDMTLVWALDHKRFIVILFVIMVMASWQLMVIIPKGFLPVEDTGQVFGMTEGAQGTSFEEMVRHQKIAAAIVAKDPNVRGFMSSVGAGGPNSSGNQGRLFIALKPHNERTKGFEQIIQDLRKKTAHIPGIRVYFQNVPTIRLGGMMTKAQYQLALSGPDLKVLYDAAEGLEKKIRDVPGVVDVNTDAQIKDKQIKLEIDRSKLSNLGLDIQQVQDALHSAYSARQVSVIYTPTNQYWVIVEVQPQFYKDPSMLSWLRIRSSTGQLIPLSSICVVSRTVGPQLVNHLGQFPAVTISFNLKPGVSLSDVVGTIKDLAKTSVPTDVSYNFQGSALAFEKSLSGLGFLLIVSILVIYIVLGMLYESFVHPITILSGLPSAGLGAFLILIACNRVLDIYGFLGLILLIGIVKKNAIMMIDFAIDYQRETQASAHDAVYEACLVRFRPIIMTTAAAILGSLPLAVGFGPGSEARQPLGLTIIGGLLVSQIVTLYITPIFYIYLDRFQRTLPKFSLKAARREPT